MRHGLRAVIFGLTLFTSRVVLAQNEIEESVIVICSAESQDVIDVLATPNSGGAYLRGENMLGYCYGNIVSQIAGNLETHNIRLDTAQYSATLDADTRQSAVMEMYTTLAIHGAPILELSPYARPLALGQYQILAAHMGSSIGMYVDSDSAKTAAASLATGIILYSLGDCDAAKTYFDIAESIGFYIDDGSEDVATTASISFYRGNCAVMIGDYEAASEYFGKASSAGYEGISLNPLLEIDLQTNLAWTYLQLGEQDKAFDLMARVVEAAEGMSYTVRFRIDALTRRAQLYAIAFRYDDAIADMDTAIELDPDNPELYILRGQITLYLYEWDRVLADYNHAIEIAPDYADAYYYRGILFYTQAHRDDALADFEHYLELAPEGDHAADAAQYIGDIQRELESLNE